MGKEEKKHYRVEVVIMDMQVNRYSSSIQDVAVDGDHHTTTYLTAAALTCVGFAIGAPTKPCVKRIAVDLLAHAVEEALTSDDG